VRLPRQALISSASSMMQANSEGRRLLKYVIGSGWWCTEDPSWGRERKRLGDDLIRTAKFHELWYKSVDRFTDPCKILIVDSASPVRPPVYAGDRRIEIVSLDENYGHSTSCETKFCGYTRSCMMGVAYAWLCDADYFVYVEQDCLLHGEGLIEHAIGQMSHDYMFGGGIGTPQPLQQSLFIIRKSAFRPFLNGLDRIRESDREVSPEVKFARLRWDWGPARIGGPQWRRWWWRRTRGRWYDPLPFGFGRARPLDWEQSHFYFQHGSREEVETYAERTGFGISAGRTDRQPQR